ncbi:hypothetical protein AGMMS4952_16450 [Spirochaetia bacterium]|nr:hypothetical protein AGMMS4952_16450 [Spirochaetia bacterium]
MKELAVTSKDKASFIAGVKAAFPDYAGENYLEMSAGAVTPIRIRPVGAGELKF